jgi:hypothetical protein
MHYLIELTTPGLTRPRYLKAQQKKRIITTRHRINARKFNELEKALDFVIDNAANYRYTFKVTVQND